MIGVGWSHSAKAIRAVIGHSPDFVFESNDAILAPMLTAEQLASAGVELTDENPPRDLLKIIKAQAADCQGETDEYGWTHVIGGPLTLTLVRPSYIEQRVIASIPFTQKN